MEDVWRGRLLMALVAVSVLFAGFAPAQGPPTELARQHLESGIQFYEQGRYKQALNDFRIIATSMSDTDYADDALLRIGQYYLDIEEDFARAKESFDAILARYPTGNAAPGAYYLLGEVIFRSDRTGGAIDDALANYQRVFLYPDNPWVPAAIYSTGRALERQGKFQDAVDAYFQVVVDYPRSEWSAGAQLGVGRSFVRQGKPIEAMAQLQEVRNHFPDSPAAESALDWLTLLFRFYGAPTLGQPISFRRDPAFRVSVKDKLKDVRSLRVSPRGIHVLERGRKRVITFDERGKLAGTQGAVNPYGLFVDPRGRLVLANEKGLVIDGKPMVLRVPSEEGPEPLEKIRVAAVDRFGDIYVFDEKQKKVLRFAGGGELLGAFPDASPREVLRIEVDGRGNVVFLEKKDRTVVVYSPEGRLVAKIATKRGQLSFKKAADIALDPAGYLYILDENQAKVAVFDATYLFLTVLTSSNLGPGALSKPRTMDVGASGDLYVYDDKDKAIVRLR